MAELGSEDAGDLFSGASLVVSSCLLEAEARAGLERARRGRRIPLREAENVRRRARRLLDEVDSIWIDGSLVRRAGDVAEAHGLRGYDAVHLASFEQVLPDALLVTSDGDLANAARSLGYAVAVPAG